MDGPEQRTSSAPQETQGLLTLKVDFGPVRRLLLRVPANLSPPGPFEHEGPGGANVTRYSGVLVVEHANHREP